MNKVFCVSLLFYIMPAFAYYTETIHNQCGSFSNELYAVFTALPYNELIKNQCGAFNNNLYAVFVVNQYSCSGGEFLPADSTECKPCPDGYTCPGGTFEFNENEFQGATKSSEYFTNNLTNICGTNAPLGFVASFIPNTHTCTPGYYLPANIDECTICPNDNICIGGTYTFNETTSQGIEACSGNTPYAPTGSAICYEHILHVGDDVVYLKSDKLTTPSLNIGMDDGIFYANMTTEPTLMNKDSEHYLKLEFNNTVYYVCDDTTLR